ncbi:MAG TPA: manganese efflux pump MntP family protein [Bacteroidales bacterium]|nr:manganese efflux pump MntP family protein [Bacteroidales bacterium]
MDGIFFIFILAIGLSFDSFAVSISSGLSLNKISFFNACKIAFSLSFFQALMPLIGWFIGSQVKNYMLAFDHWIAFGLLFLLGIKMIYESIEAWKNGEEKKFNPLNFYVLIGMSLATSIDALAVGLSFALLGVHIIIASFIIGAVTFIISMTGILVGKKTGGRFGKQMEIIGGLILMGIGLKILIQHLYF